MSQTDVKKKLTVSTSFADVLETMGENTSGSQQSHNVPFASKWTRSSPGPIDEAQDTIAFQHIDIQEGKGRRPTILLFGITQEGHTVLAHVQDFKHYFYFPCPEGLTDDDLEPIVAAVNNILRAENDIPIVDSILRTSEYPRREERKKYFLKIFISNPRRMKDVRDVFDKGRLNYKDFFCSPEKLYESKISYIRRFMMDTKINSMAWVEVPAGSYTLIPESNKQSHCQMEFSVSYIELEAHEFKEDWGKVAPLRILSFDIECRVRSRFPGKLKQKDSDMIFSDHKVDAVVQIANMVTQYGADEPFVRNIFTLGSCAPITGAQIFSFDLESELLKSWQEFIIDVDPDLIIGYNIGRFDLPYMLNRAKLLRTAEFAKLGRIKDIPVKASDIQGQRDWKDTPRIPGRTFLDILYFVQQECRSELQRAGGTKLNAVANYFLEQRKEDVPVHTMSKLQNGDENTRRDLAIYCLKDAYLPQQLMDKFDGLNRWIDISRDHWVPFNALLYLDERTKKSLKDRDITNSRGIYPDD